MKEIRATEFGFSFGTSYSMVYEIEGQEFNVSGEFFYNREKSRYEHIHICPDCSEILIFW